jgi:hypothetical protein
MKKYLFSLLLFVLFCFLGTLLLNLFFENIPWHFKSLTGFISIILTLMIVEKNKI